MMQNANMQALRANPEEEAGADNGLTQEDYAEKKRLDREARLERRK